MSSSLMKGKFLPRSEKSFSHIRIQSSLSKKNLKVISKQQPSTQLKFKPITELKQERSFQKQERSFQNKQITNNLQSKYNIYNYGSPNRYSYCLQTHKASNLRNQIHSLDLTFIDNVIREIHNTQTNTSSNLRDLQLYPNLIKTHQTHKFNQLLSDKQELSDFMTWLQTSLTLIEQQQTPVTRKFHSKQIIVAAAFSEILQQVGKLSKQRSQILRMLWNKSTQQVEQLIHYLSSKVISVEKQHLTVLSQTHSLYQSQMEELKIQNQELTRKLNQETLMNVGLVNTLRCNRKLIRKQELLIKKLFDANESVVKDNLNLLDQNTKLLMNQTTINMPLTGDRTKITQKKHARTYGELMLSQHQKCQQPKTQLKYSQARLLLYRRLQIASINQRIKQTRKSAKKQIIPQLKQNSISQVDSQHLSLYQLEEKKQSLLKYLQQRFEENQCEKLYVGDWFCNEDYQNVETGDVESAIRSILSSKLLEVCFMNENDVGKIMEWRDVGVNTSLGLIEKQQKLTKDHPNHQGDNIKHT